MKQIKFTATVKSVNTSLFSSDITSEDGTQYKQVRQLTVCTIDDIANPSEFTPAQVTAIKATYVGLEVTGSKTLVGKKQALESLETGVPVMKDSAKVKEEVTLYLSRVPNTEGTGFMNFFEIGAETGIANDALEERVASNSVLADLFNEMMSAE